MTKSRSPHPDLAFVVGLVISHTFATRRTAAFRQSAFVRAARLMCSKKPDGHACGGEGDNRNRRKSPATPRRGRSQTWRKPALLATRMFYAPQAFIPSPWWREKRSRRWASVRSSRKQRVGLKRERKLFLRRRAWRYFLAEHAQRVHRFIGVACIAQITA
jgi:hypothetical protein